MDVKFRVDSEDVLVGLGLLVLLVSLWFAWAPLAGMVVGALLISGGAWQCVRKKRLSEQIPQPGETDGDTQ